VAIDFACGRSHPLASINTVNIDKAEPYNAVCAVKREIESDKTRHSIAAGGTHQVILLGSSLMVAPALQDQALFMGHEFKRFHERRLSSFEKYLGEAVQTQASHVPAVRSYCLAMGGQMASDASLIARQIVPLASQAGPVSVIYGIAPRDFHDNLFPRIDSSPAFKIFAELNDLPQLFRSEPSMNAVDQSSATFERLSSLYRYRSDWQKLAEIRGKRIIEKCLPEVVFDKYYDTAVLKPQKKGLLAGEAIGTPSVVPGAALDHNDWLKTEAEYRRRYIPLNQQKTEAQFAYLDKLIQYCQSERVNLMVVNMPLSEDNLKLLPPQSYSNYLANAKKLCRLAGVEFVDLNCAPWTANSNFVDSVHLAPERSKAFMQKLASIIAGSSLTLATKTKRQPI